MGAHSNNLLYPIGAIAYRYVVSTPIKALRASPMLPDIPTAALTVLFSRQVENSPVNHSSQ